MPRAQPKVGQQDGLRGGGGSQPSNSGGLPDPQKRLGFGALGLRAKSPKWGGGLAGKVERGPVELPKPISPEPSNPAPGDVARICF